MLGNTYGITISQKAPGFSFRILQDVSYRRKLVSLSLLLLKLKMTLPGLNLALN